MLDNPPPPLLNESGLLQGDNPKSWEYNGEKSYALGISCQVEHRRTRPFRFWWILVYLQCPIKKHVYKILPPNDLRGQMKRSSKVTIFHVHYNIEPPVVFVPMHLEGQNDC